MWRFVLRENIGRFHALMEHAHSREERETLELLLQDARQELEELEEASTPEIARRDAWLNSLAGRAVDQAIALQGAQFASLQIYDERREHLIILAQRNLRVEFLHWLSHMKPGDGSAVGRCLLANAPIAIPDVENDEGFERHRPAAREAGFRAVRAFPVRNGAGGLIAVLSAYFEAPQRFADDEELNRMIAFNIALGKNLETHLASAPS